MTSPQVELLKNDAVARLFVGFNEFQIIFKYGWSSENRVWAEHVKFNLDGNDPYIKWTSTGSNHGTISLHDVTLEFDDSLGALIVKEKLA